MFFFSSSGRAALMFLVSLAVAPYMLRAQLATPAPTSSGMSTQEIVDTPDPQTTSSQPPRTDQTGNISGTVTDANADLVTGVDVTLEGVTAADRRVQAVNESGFFNFAGLKAGVPYRVTISGAGFAKWTSQPIVLAPGQFFAVNEIKLILTDEGSSVTVYSSTEEIATQQVEIAEQQRVLGFIPNFYVIYDSKNAVPLTTKLKFRMAYKVSIDPVSIVGAAFMAGVNQAFDRPGYQQGMKGYAERFGQEYADGVTDIMFGGAILPSLLHQDPRYYYKGTGSIKSRTLRALSNPFICKGDNGRWQPNYSSVGGDLASSALSNLYYPKADRGVGATFQSLLVDTAERAGTSLFQEFVVRKLTPSARRNN